MLLVELGFVTYERTRAEAFSIHLVYCALFPVFNNNIFGDAWIRKFLMRHKLSRRTTYSISKKRAEKRRLAQCFSNVFGRDPNIAKFSGMVLTVQVEPRYSISSLIYSEGCALRDPQF